MAISDQLGETGWSWDMLTWAAPTPIAPSQVYVTCSGCCLQKKILNLLCILGFSSKETLYETMFPWLGSQINYFYIFLKEWYMLSFSEVRYLF